MKKRWMIFVLACCLTAGITGSVVYAYLIDEKEEVHQIRILENTTHIEEEFEPPDEVKPGQVIKKKPCIANDSGFPVFIRRMGHPRFLFLCDGRLRRNCHETTS